MPRTMPKQKPGRSKQNYRTPKNLFNAILKRLAIDHFAFDFAADRFNTKAKYWWGEKDNSLARGSKNWLQMLRGEWGWLNPPFARIGRWARKCVMTHRRGGKIALLVPASVGSNWFLQYIWQEPGVKVIYLNGRPSFDGKAGFPKDCMLVLFLGTQLRPFESEVWTWKETAE